MEAATGNEFVMPSTIGPRSATNSIIMEDNELAVENTMNVFPQTANSSGLNLLNWLKERKII